MARGMSDIANESTVLQAAEKMQKRIEDQRQAKEPCRQRELGFGDKVERPTTPPANIQRLAVSGIPRS
jgi:hypothetical protein